MKKPVPVDMSQMERGDARWRKALGDNVRGLRLSRRISQLQLASRLCWPVATLVKLEAGELNLSEGQERDLARWTEGLGKN